MRRGGALACAAIGGCVTRAGFNANGQRHVFNRRHQIARNIHRQGLEWRDINRVQAFARRSSQIQKRGQEASQSLAPAGGRHQQRVITARHRRQNIKLMRPRLPATRRKPAGKRFW